MLVQYKYAKTGPISAAVQFQRIQIIFNGKLEKDIGTRLLHTHKIFKLPRVPRVLAYPRLHHLSNFLESMQLSFVRPEGSVVGFWCT